MNTKEGKIYCTDPDCGEEQKWCKRCEMYHHKDGFKFEHEVDECFKCHATKVGLTEHDNGNLYCDPCHAKVK